MIFFWKRKKKRKNRKEKKALFLRSENGNVFLHMRHHIYAAQKARPSSWTSGHKRTILGSNFSQWWQNDIWLKFSFFEFLEGKRDRAWKRMSKFFKLYHQQYSSITYFIMHGFQKNQKHTQLNDSTYLCKLLMYSCNLAFFKGHQGNHEQMKEWKSIWKMWRIVVMSWKDLKKF